MTSGMRAAVVLALAVVLGGCGIVEQMRKNTNRSPAPPVAPPLPVRPADLQAWQGAPRMELETHTLFSTVPRTVTLLSDGSELWDYANCRGDVCCHNQFFLAGPSVQAYRAVGDCYTDCSTRPASRQCPQAELTAQAQARAAAARDEASRARWQRVANELARQRQEEERRKSTTECRPDGLGGMRCETR